MRFVIVALLLTMVGCHRIFRYSEPPAPRPTPVPAPTRAPAPAPQQVLPQEEAIAFATHFVRSRGLSVSHVRNAYLDGAGRWHVELRGDRGRDKAQVLVDGWTGQILRAKLKDEDRDWEDEQKPPSATAD